MRVLDCNIWKEHLSSSPASKHNYCKAYMHSKESKDTFQWKSVIFSGNIWAFDIDRDITGLWASDIWQRYYWNSMWFQLTLAGSKWFRELIPLHTASTSTLKSCNASVVLQSCRASEWPSLSLLHHVGVNPYSCCQLILQSDTGIVLHHDPAREQ